MDGGSRGGSARRLGGELIAAAERLGTLGADALGRITVGARATTAVARSGLLGPERPDRLIRVAAGVVRLGPIAGSCAGAAARWGGRPALVDDEGALSYEEIDARSSALACAWADRGLGPGDGLGVLCRNHRGFVDALFAGAKLGMRVVLLNTEFAAPQLAAVAARERLSAIVADDDLIPRTEAAGLPVYVTGDGGGEGTEALISRALGRSPGAPSEHATLVLMTSGTTGTPKGAQRRDVRTIETLGALLSRVPLRTKEATLVGPPLFHALGLAQAMLAFNLGSAIVVSRRFDPEAMLALAERHRVTALIVVPAMLQRILALGHERIRSFDTGALRVIFSAGSQLPGSVATETMDVFGDLLYVLYGSTEVAYATLAAPADLRAAPTTVGPPVLGATVKLLDESGREVPVGSSGRIFVSNGVEFEGYTDGGGKEVIDGLMSSGDVGHFDAHGRLFIDGRDDDMIVSGGENVFPQEVEELLIGHPSVADAAVVGVPDEDFGARLAAFVVPASGCEPRADDLREHVRVNLARYKVPRDVSFVEELPRNATGKVLRRELGGAAAPPDVSPRSGP